MEILKTLGLISGDTLEKYHITIFAIILGIMGLGFFIMTLMNL